MAGRTTILIASDNFEMLENMKNVAHERHPESYIISAQDGLDAWNLIQKRNPQVVICDINLPTFDAFKLLSRIRGKKETENIYFIILTAIFDQEKREQALDVGADDFVTKPVSNDEFLARLRNALRIVRLLKEKAEETKLIMQLAEELENDIEDMTRLAVKFLQARIPASYDTLKRISAASFWIASQLELEPDEAHDIEIAGLLCLSGKVFLPDNKTNKPVQVEGRASDKLMYQVPVTAREILQSVRRYSEVSNIVYHIFENFDGSGFPEKLKSWQIPIGARIVRVALDYENWLNLEKKPKEALDKLFTNAKKLYDHRAVVLMEHYIKSVVKESHDPTEIAVKLQNLREGMVLTRDLVTNSGIMLIPGGHMLTEKNINQIISINTSDPILGTSIYVRRRKLS